MCLVISGTSFEMLFRYRPIRYRPSSFPESLLILSAISHSDWSEVQDSVFHLRTFAPVVKRLSNSNKIDIQKVECAFTDGERSATLSNCLLTDSLTRLLNLSLFTPSYCCHHIIIFYVQKVMYKQHCKYCAVLISINFILSNII